MSAVDPEHDARVREQFRVQASTFDDRGWATSGLGWIVEVAEPGPGDAVLDVAAGAAHLGRALTPHVDRVVALDLTPEMVAQGRRLAAEQGLDGFGYVVGDAASMPLPDDAFDLVACRLTLHQVADPAAVVREMVRVTRPGGQVLVVDLAVVDADAADETNRLERLRDPSHGRTLTEAEVRGLLEDAGAEVDLVRHRDNPVDVADWLERTATPADARAEVVDRFEAELVGGPPTGLRPRHRDDGALELVHDWMAVRARVPAAGRSGRG